MSGRLADTEYVHSEFITNEHGIPLYQIRIYKYWGILNWLKGLLRVKTVRFSLTINGKQTVFITKIRCDRFIQIWNLQTEKFVFESPDYH